MLKPIVLGAALVLLLGGSTAAQIVPRKVELDKYTCADLLSTKGERRFRLLVYLNGYVNGLRGQKVWDEHAEGELIDRAMKECKATPTKIALDVFTGVWPR